MSGEVDPRDVRKAGTPWTDNDVKRLRNLALGGTAGATDRAGDGPAAG